MRKGRFAGLSDSGPEAGARLAVADLLLFDFETPDDQSAEAIQGERAALLASAPIFLALAHSICGAFLSFHSGSVWQLIPFALVLALDFAFWAVAAGKPRAHRLTRLTALYVLLSAAAWSAGIAGLAAGADDTAVRIVLLAGAAAAVPALFPVPGLLFLGCSSAIAAVLLLNPQPELVALAGGVSLSLLLLSFVRSGQAIVGGYRRLGAEWQAEKARRFVAEFEQSGRGWFWETNADGDLTYVSDALASHLGSTAAALAGTAFADLLQAKDDDALAGDRGLGFHLSARFPFSDVTVRARGEGEIWWALSGSPNFDHYGRFLGFRGLGTNLTEQRRSEAEISKLAKYDSLTGLPNRAMMRVTLDEALANADRRRKGCSLLLIDLDRFKQVNDTLGHPIGDVLLRKVGERLRSVIGEEGQIGRLGGDEFEAILPGTDEEARLANLSARLIAEVSRPYSIKGHRISIGASVGIAVAMPGKAYAEALIKDADLALYAAKAAGKGTYRFFSSDMHAEATDRQILEEDLRSALVRGQIRLFYQPIVDSVTEEVVAFEALLRWAHPTRGVLPPDLFIPIAEEAGLIGAIGEWVLRSACREAAGWPDHVRVAVNVSPIQFADPAIAATVTGALAAAQIAPDRLELEITEAVFQTESAATDKTFASLKAAGVRLVLDNFGTDRSSLGYLRKAPLDKIKVDQSFVRGAASAGTRNAAIIRAIVTLAESLGMDTTAEGAETHEELTLIRQLGCSQVQGFIFASPVAADEALVLARESKGSRAQAPEYSRPPRHRLIRTGMLQWKGKVLSVRLRNISAGGAMVECDRAVGTGERVALDLADAGTLDAEVRWCREGQLGLRFEEEFELRKLARSAAAGVPAQTMLRPHYLDTETKPDSPWAARSKRLTPKEVRRF
jgi:diguanylate cyclase (GGDEF)-like protein